MKRTSVGVGRIHRICSVLFGSADRVVALVGWFAFFSVLTITVAPGLLSDKVFLSTQSLGLFAPWSQDWDAIHGNTMAWDTIDSAAPMDVLIARHAQEGHGLALWDPYGNGGAPLATLPNSAMLSPLSLPWWILPVSAAPSAVKILEALTVAGGMYLLLRRQWGLARATIPIASLSYFMSGFMVAWTNWPQTRVAAFVPLFFWCVERIATGNGRWRLISLALVTACMLLGGFPAIIGYAVYAAVPYFVVRVVAERRGWRRAAIEFCRAAGGILLGVGLSAVQLLPFIQLTMNEVDFEARVSNNADALPSQVLATVVAPHALGDPGYESEYWQVHPVEVFSYFGAALLVMALIGLIISPPRMPRGTAMFFGASTLVVGAAVYHDGVAHRLLQMLPLVSSSPMGRMRVLLGVFGAVLVAAGVECLVGRREKDPRSARTGCHIPAIAAFCVRLGVALAIAILIAVATWQSVLDTEDTAAIHDTKLIALCMVIVGVLAASAVFWKGRLGRGAGFATAVLVVVISAVSSVQVGQAWWPLSASSTLYPTTRAHVFLDGVLGQQRYIASNFAMMPGTATIYEQRSVNGHSFGSARWANLLEAAIPGLYMSATYTSAPAGTIQQGIGAAVLDRMGVEYAVTGLEEAVPGEIEYASAESSWADSGDTVMMSRSITGPARGVLLRMRGDVPADSMFHVTAVDDATGEVLTQTSIAGPYLELHSGFVPLALEGVTSDQPWHAETVVESGDSLELGVDESGTMVVDVMRAADDGLTLVYADEVLIYHRDTALGRIRWASEETVIEPEEERIDALVAGGIPDDTVVLENSADASLVDSESTAVITSEDVDTNTIQINVDASGAGWVVVADPLQMGGWSATVDGESAQLVDAEQVGGAVRIGSGEHTIVLRYCPLMFRVGIVISILSLSGIVFTIIRHRFSRRFPPDSMTDASPSDPDLPGDQDTDPTHDEIRDGQHHAGQQHHGDDAAGGQRPRQDEPEHALAHARARGNEYDQEADGPGHGVPADAQRQRRRRAGHSDADGQQPHLNSGDRPGGECPCRAGADPGPADRVLQRRPPREPEDQRK